MKYVNPTALMCFSKFKHEDGSLMRMGLTQFRKHFPNGYAGGWDGTWYIFIGLATGQTLEDFPRSVHKHLHWHIEGSYWFLRVPNIVPPKVERGYKVGAAMVKYDAVTDTIKWAVNIVRELTPEARAARMQELRERHRTPPTD